MKDWSTLDFNIFLNGKSCIERKDICGIDQNCCYCSCASNAWKNAILYLECFSLQVKYCQTISWLKARAMNHCDSFIVYGQYRSSLALSTKKKRKNQTNLQEETTSFGEVLEKLHSKIHTIWALCFFNM